MKKIMCTGLICFVGILFVAGTGCSGNQRAEANELANKFNARIEKYNELDKEAEKSMQDFNLAATTKDEFVKNVEVVKETDSTVIEQKKELDKALRLLGKAQKMGISDEFKKYIEIQQEASGADIKRLNLTREMLAEIKKMYEAKSSLTGLSREESDAMNETIFDLVAKAKIQDGEADKLKAKARKYYKEHDIGK